MKTRKGNILNMGRDNEPVPGCTVSESIYDDGRQAITLFSLAKGTNISAERYPHPTMYLTLRGLPTFFSPDEWRAEAGEGEQFVFEKGGLHSVKAVTKFKMALLLTLD